MALLGLVACCTTWGASAALSTDADVIVIG